MKNNKKSEVVSEQVYDYPVDRRHFLTVDYGKYFFCCGKCHHIHMLTEAEAEEHKERIAFVERYGNKYKSMGNMACPHCKTELPVYLNVWQKALHFPERVHIAKKANGNINVNIIACQMNAGFNRNRHHFYQKSRWYAFSYVFRKNGTITFVSPCWVDNHRRCSFDTSQSLFCNITFASEHVYNSNTIKELEKAGILPKNSIRRHRFSNISESFLNVINKFFDNTNRLYALTPKKIFHKILSCIKKEDTDEEALTHILQKLRLPQSKKFRKLFFEKPIDIAYKYLLFRSACLSDINNFYSLIKNDDLLDTIREAVNFPPYMVQKSYYREYLSMYGEKAVIQQLLLGNFKKYFFDTVLYRQQMEDITSPYFTRPEILAQSFHRNIKTMHDNFMRLIEKQKNNDNKIAIIKNAEYILSHDVNESQKKDILDKIERMQNNPITYTNERKLETTHKGISFILPEDTDELLTAGNELHNCVGHNYRIYALHHASTIVLMKQKEKLVGCIEIGKKNQVYQALGPCNKSLADTPKEAFEEWADTHNLKTKGKIDCDHSYVIDTSDFREKLQNFVDNQQEIIHSKAYESYNDLPF